MELIYGPLIDYVEITVNTAETIKVGRHRDSKHSHDIIVQNNLIENPEWLLNELIHE